MKVMYEMNNAKKITQIAIGTPFLGKKENGEEKVLYIKIDDTNNGIINKVRGKSYAINLKNGRIRQFDNNDLIEELINTQITVTI